MNKKTNPLVYVINLPWARQRRHRIQYQLEKYNIRHRIMDGVDANFIDDYERLRHRMNEISEYKSRLLNSGEQGAVLSHKNIYEMMLARDNDYALILEDDAIIDKRLAILLDNIEKLPLRWNICFLGYFYDTLGEPFFGSQTYPISFWRRQELDFLPGHKIGKLILRPRGAFGYLISQEAAKKLLSTSYDAPALVADRALSNCEIPGIVAIAPSLVKHDNIDVETCITNRPPSNFEYWTINRQLNTLEKGFVKRIPFLRLPFRLAKNMIRRLRASFLYLISPQYNRYRQDYEV